MFSKTAFTAASNWNNLYDDVRSLGGTITSDGMFFHNTHTVVSARIFISMPSSEDYLALKLKYNLYE